MRVLIVTPYYFPATCFGGPVWTVRDLARGLLGMGASVEVVTTSANRPHDDLPHVDTVDGVRVCYARRYANSGWYFSPELARNVADMASRFDLLCVQGVWVFSSIVGSIVAQLQHKPFVMAPRGSFDPWALAHKGLKKRVYLSLIEKRHLRRAAAVHCLTQQEKNQVLALVPEARCKVIPNSVTLDPSSLTDEGIHAFSARFPETRGKRVVLFLSRIHKKKGLDLLIPAFARVRAAVPDAHLIIAGPDDSGYLTVTEGLVDQYRLRQNVTFTGLVNGQDKLAAMQLAEVFVLPSYSEGLPVVVLEAMAFGKPVVITDACNLTDEVMGAKAGLVVGTNVSQLSEGIARLLQDTDTARSMGEAALRLVSDRFSPYAVTREFLKLLEDVTSHAGRT